MAREIATVGWSHTADEQEIMQHAQQVREEQLEFEQKREARDV